MPPPCQACALDRCSRPYSVQRWSSTEDHLLSSRLASARSSPSREHSSEAGKRGGAFPTSQSSRPSFIRSPRTDTCSIGSRATPSRVMRAWPSTGKTDPAQKQEGHLDEVEGGRRGQGTIHCDGGNVEWTTGGAQLMPAMSSSPDPAGRLWWSTSRDLAPRKASPLWKAVNSRLTEKAVPPKVDDAPSIPRKRAVPFGPWRPREPLARAIAQRKVPI